MFIFDNCFHCFLYCFSCTVGLWKAICFVILNERGYNEYILLECELGSDRSQLEDVVSVVSSKLELKI